MTETPPANGPRPPARPSVRPSPSIALWQGDDRGENLRRALALVIDGIDWASRRRVVVKPNLTSPHRQLADTHPEALATVLGVIRRRYDGPLAVAEGCILQPTHRAFADMGFVEIARDHGADLVDLNGDDGVPVRVYDRRARPLRLRLARTLVESDCRVSLTVPKTHDTVLVTLAIKNLVMGGLVGPRLAAMDGLAGRPLGRLAWRLVARVGARLGWPAAARNDKTLMHQGSGIINVNLALLAAVLLPDLAVIDGFEAMEGAGPIDGTPAPWRVAFAGTTALALDGLVAGLMGFPPDQVGYLRYCADLGLGDLVPAPDDVIANVAPDSLARTFVPHPQHLAQRAWPRPDAPELLTRGVGAGR